MDHTFFLSYARGDDEPFVRRLHDSLVRSGIALWWDRKDMPSRGLAFLQEIRDAIDDCERLILVVGPGAVASDYVRAEWQYALARSKPVIPILRLSSAEDLPHELSRVHCLDFRLDGEYQASLEQLALRLRDPLPPLGLLHGVPALPPHFQPRGMDVSRLYEALLPDLQRPIVATPFERLVVLHGMGGVGKSVLASAFARSTETRLAFGEGICWLDASSESGLLEGLARARTAFGCAPEKDAAPRQERVADLLSGKRRLVVLDNLGDAQQAAPFLRTLDGPGRLLITTRDAGLATTLGGRAVPVDELSAAQSLQHLADWVGAPDVAALPAQAREVARECGNVPFALALCGAMVADGIDWSDLLERFAAADLGYFEKQFPEYPHPSLLRCLAVSHESLRDRDPEGAKVVCDLVVLAEGSRAPDSVIEMLWARTKGFGAAHAHRLLVTLERRAIVRIDRQQQPPRVWLHDLQRRYLSALVPDALALHEELVAAYQARCSSGWATGPNDGYFFEYLVYHLRAARGPRAADELLLGSSDWLDAKRRVGAPTDFVTDLERVLADISDRPGSDFERLVGLFAARTAASLGVSVLPDGLIMALARRGRVEEALRYAGLRTDLLDRLRAFLLIDRPFRDREPGGSNLALEAAQQLLETIREVDTRHQALATLAEHLSRTGRQERAMPYLELLHREKAPLPPSLAVILSRHFSASGRLAEAQSLTQNLEPELRAIVDASPGPARLERGLFGAWGAVRRALAPSTSDRSRERLVGVLASEHRFSLAQKVLARIGDEKIRSAARFHLASVMGRAGRVRAAIGIAQTIPEPYLRVAALATIGEPTSVAAALEVTRSAEDAQKRIELLLALLRALERGRARPQLMEEIQSALSGLGDPEQRLRDLEGLAELIDPVERAGLTPALITLQAEILAESDAKKRLPLLATLAAVIAWPGMAEERVMDSTIAETIEQLSRYWDPVDRDRALAQVAGALAEEGDSALCRRLLEGIEDEETRQQGALAACRAPGGEVSAAVLAGLLPWLSGANATLIRVGALARSGRAGEAADVALRAEGLRERLALLAEAVAGIAAGGHLEEARRVARSMETADGSYEPPLLEDISAGDLCAFYAGWAWCEIAAAVVPPGEGIAALVSEIGRLLERIETRSLRARLASRAAYVLSRRLPSQALLWSEVALANAEALSKPISVISDFGKPLTARSNFVADVVRTIARCGDIDRALAVARDGAVSETDQRVFRVVALARIAAELVDRPALADELVREAAERLQGVHDSWFFRVPERLFAQVELARAVAALGRIKSALAMMSEANANFDYYIFYLASWKKVLRRHVPAGMRPAIREALRIAGWVRPDWGRWANILR
jgi:hypothetical protein